MRPGPTARHPSTPRHSGLCRREAAAGFRGFPGQQCAVARRWIGWRVRGGLTGGLVGVVVIVTGGRRRAATVMRSETDFPSDSARISTVPGATRCDHTVAVDRRHLGCAGGPADAAVPELLALCIARNRTPGGSLSHLDVPVRRAQLDRRDRDRSLVHGNPSRRTTCPPRSP